MPICPWPQLIVFAFGAGSSLLITSLVGAVAYNGKFGDDNKFRKYSYGWDYKFGQMCVVNVSLAMFTIAFVMLAVFFNIKHLPKSAQIVMWVFADLAFIGTIVSQGLSIEWSKYGDSIQFIPSKFDYFNDKKFKNYVQKYYPEAVESSTTGPSQFEICNEALNPGCNDTSLPAYNLFNEKHMPYFFSTFYIGDEPHQVPQCKIEWQKCVPTGKDPCNWVIKDGNCIGGWSPESFKNYWCYAFRHNRTYVKSIQGKSEYEVQRYEAEKLRVEFSVDSYDAFYEINNIFIGLECSGFGIATVTLFILLCINPFDKDKIHFKKIEASGSGSASVKPIRKGGSSGSGSK